MRIIQFLNCDIKSIITQLDNIKKQNFDTVQINPVQPFIDVEGYDWWATYQPLDFSIGNIYGSKEDLISLCEEAKKRGLKIVVDVVSNHLANDGANKLTIPHHDIPEYIRSNKDYWKRHFKVNEFTSYKDIIEESIGMPGLDLRNKDLQNIVLNFLTELKDCGVSGFRFDAAKHIGLPTDGVDYFEKIQKFLDENNLFAYSEFLDGPNDLGDELRKTLLEKKNEFADLMYILTEENSVVDNSSKKVTFIESHDTFLNDFGSTKGKSIEEIINAYVELTKKYEHTLFYVRDTKDGKKIPDGYPDRMPYMDTSWINNEKLRLANLNTGKEYEKLERKRKEAMLVRKSEKAMQLHGQICKKIHEVLINQLDENSTIEDHVDFILLDYNIQSMLNSMLGVIPYDDLLIDSATREFYFSDHNKQAVKNLSFYDYSYQVLTSLRDRCINRDVVDGLDEKIGKVEDEITDRNDDTDGYDDKPKTYRK